EHVSATLTSAGRQLVGEPALSDPGLASDEEEAATPGERILEPRLELGQLTLPPDERAHRAADVSDQVKRVRVSLGARPPGRRPRRTKTVGAGGALAISPRTRPRPSLRQRSENPTTRTPAPSASAITPSRPGLASSGSATTSAVRWTISEASARSRLASLPSSRLSEAAPIRSSSLPAARATQVASSSAAQSCSAAPNGTTTGPAPSGPPASRSK